VGALDAAEALSPNANAWSSNGIGSKIQEIRTRLVLGKNETPNCQGDDLIAVAVPSDTSILARPMTLNVNAGDAMQPGFALAEAPCVGVPRTMRAMPGVPPALQMSSS